VFPIDDLPVNAFQSEIKHLLIGVKAISFSIHQAVLIKDALSDKYHCFLVPDEGFTAIAEIYDALFSEKLSSYLRPDIPSIPPLTIAAR
jgi:hypothetical protein